MCRRLLWPCSWPAAGSNNRCVSLRMRRPSLPHLLGPLKCRKNSTIPLRLNLCNGKSSSLLLLLLLTLLPPPPLNSFTNCSRFLELISTAEMVTRSIAIKERRRLVTLIQFMAKKWRMNENQIAISVFRVYLSRGSVFNLAHRNYTWWHPLMITMIVIGITIWTSSRPWVKHLFFYY